MLQLEGGTVLAPLPALSAARPTLVQLLRLLPRPGL